MQVLRLAAALGVMLTAAAPLAAQPSPHGPPVLLSLAERPADVARAAGMEVRAPVWPPGGLAWRMAGEDDIQFVAGKPPDRGWFANIAAACRAAVAATARALPGLVDTYGQVNFLRAFAELPAGGAWRLAGPVRLGPGDPWFGGWRADAFAAGRLVGAGVPLDGAPLPVAPDLATAYPVTSRLDLFGGLASVPERLGPGRGQAVWPAWEVPISVLAGLRARF
jgi:hypothetical protein